MKQQTFGQTKDGEEVFLYTLENQQGMSVTVSNFGAILSNLWVNDHNQIARDVVLGYERVADYEKNLATFFGATIGRNGNRIAQAKFEIEGQTHHLVANEGENNLHSGPNGYHLRLWDVEEYNEAENSLTFALVSPDQDQGFPGELTLRVTYQLSEDNTLKIIYRGSSDQATVFNPTNHSYFNLNGHQSGNILKHQLQLQAEHFTPVQDAASIPTGEIISVANTPMDFRKLTTIGEKIDKDYAQLQFTQGYDHNYVVDPGQTKVATLIGDQSGITLEVASNLPGVQFYSGNFIQAEAGKEGTVYKHRAGLCLETQFYPDAINQGNFLSPVILKDQVVEYWTSFKFKA